MRQRMSGFWGAFIVRPAGSLYTAGAACSVKFGVSDSVGELTIRQGESQRVNGVTHRARSILGGRQRCANR